MSKKIFISLLGLPGTGKGTQGKLLAKREKMQYISTGDLVKAWARKEDQSKFTQDLKARYGKGIIQPDSVLKSLLFEKLKRTCLEYGIIFDQFPFSLKQITYLEKMIEKYNYKALFVVNLTAPEDVLVKRLSQRLICTHCNLSFGPQKKEYQKGICNCGRALVRRKDDEPQIVKKRIALYKKLIKPLKVYYKKKKYVFLDIDASLDIEIVQTNLINLLVPLINKVK